MKLALVIMATLSLFRCNGDEVTEANSDNSAAKPILSTASPSSAESSSISGVFTIPVRSIGQYGTLTYLNSEEEYWDSENLAIELTPEIRQEFLNIYGEIPEVYLHGKSIQVRGEARKIRINKLLEGKPHHYYQTRLTLESLKDLNIVS